MEEGQLGWVKQKMKIIPSSILLQVKLNYSCNFINRHNDNKNYF